MIENYLKLLEQDKPEISSEDEKEINLFKKLVLAGSQTAFDAVLEFSRRQQLGLYKDVNFIIDPDALLIEVTDKKSSFKNKDVFDDAMIRLLNSGKFSKNKKIQIDQRGSFFDDHKEFLFSKFPLLMFRQSFLENFNHVCENGNYESHHNHIFEIIMIYGFEFLLHSYKKHDKFRESLYFHGFINTDILWFFRGWENYTEFQDKFEKQLEKLPTLNKYLPSFSSFKDEEEKKSFIEKDMELYKNKWRKISNFFLETLHYSNNEKPTDYLFYFEKDKNYLPLKLTFFGKYILSSLISIIRQTNTFFKNEFFKRPFFLSTEAEIKSIISELILICDVLEKTYPDLHVHIKNNYVTDCGGFGVGFIMRDKQQIDIEEELQKKE